MLHTIKRSFKYLYQKIRYGICDKDVWNVDIYFAEKMVKALKAFERMKRHGYPVWLVNSAELEGDEGLDIDNHNECYYFWEAIIWRLIDGFERIANQFDIFSEDEEYNSNTMDLFVEVYSMLWD